MTVSSPGKVAKNVATKKSGLKAFKPGDVMFNQGDSADSLYIIQKGQVRLYIPKGRGYVDLAILRSGEVIGEMAYFDDKASRRSCSAAAIVTTEVIEISFKAFDKTMQGLNPWFKTIVNTLADRLRRTNEKVKELETNSVGFSGGKVGDYKFYHTSDIIRILGLIYMVFKSHGDLKDDGYFEIHTNKLKFYAFDIYGIQEIKYEEFMHLMQSEALIDIANDEDNLPKIVRVKEIENFRSMMMFFNTEKLKDDSKKLNISTKCERFLSKIVQQCDVRMSKGGIKSLHEGDVPEGTKLGDDQAVVDLSAILNDFKEKNIPVSEEDLRDGITAGLVGDIIVGKFNKLVCIANYSKLKKLISSIRLTNAIAKVNESKASSGKY